MNIFYSQNVWIPIYKRINILDNFINKVKILNPINQRIKKNHLNKNLLN